MDAPPPLARPDAPGLFSRYQRVIRVTFVGVLLAAAAVMAVEVNNAYETELELEAARMLTHGGTLSGIFSSAGEHVHSLRRAAETYLVNHPTPPEPPSPLYQALVSSARDGLFTLDNPPPPWTTEVTSNVTGPSRAPERGPSGGDLDDDIPF